MPAKAAASGAEPVFTQRSYKRTICRFELHAEFAFNTSATRATTSANIAKFVGQLAVHVERARAVTRALTQHARQAVVGPGAECAHVAQLHAARRQVVGEEAACVQHSLNSEVLPAPFELEEAGFDHKQGFMKIETAPRSSNPNLHAQSGVFTVIEGELASDYTADEYVLKVAAKMSQHSNDQLGYPFMRKLTLPGTCGRQLQRLLFEEGITGSSLFPGLEGVVRSLKERAIWSRT